MLGQMAVVSEIIGDTASAHQAVENAYGGSFEAVSDAWNHAMEMDNSRHAAEYILAKL